MLLKLTMLLCLFTSLVGCATRELAVNVTPASTFIPQPAATNEIGIPTTFKRNNLRYRDRFLCFTVDLRAVKWKVDGVAGGFASFSSSDGLFLRIVNVYLEGYPTLPEALETLQQGAYGQVVRNVEEVAVSGREALFIELEAQADVPQYVILVIGPNCGDGYHALFIDASGTTRQGFIDAMRRVRFFE